MPPHEGALQAHGGMPGLGADCNDAGQHRGAGELHEPARTVETAKVA